MTAKWAAVNGYLLALLITAAFVALEVFLSKKGLLERYNLQLYGPFLMWKTKKGREFIDRTARKREGFWKKYADFGIALIFIFMFGGTVLLIWIAEIATHIPAKSAPNPVMMLGIPGINPIIPLWYGILGLVVAIIFHEFSHGILARVAKVKIRSLGLLFFVFPVGAFVEPDEEEVERIPKRKRMRIYAVGPTANIILAVIFGLMFVAMASQIQPVNEGIIVSGVYEGTPASDALSPGMEIVSVNGTAIRTGSEFSSAPFPPAPQNVSLGVIQGGERREISVVSGLVITDVTDGYAAANAGISSGMIIASLNGSTVHNYDDFLRALSDIKPGQTVNISVYQRENGAYRRAQINTITFTKDDKYSYYERFYPSLNREDYRGKAIMGVGVSMLGMEGFGADTIPRLYSHPFWGSRTPEDYVKHSLAYISMPVMGLMPLNGDIASLYSTGGMPPSVFWILLNSLYWIFWLNLMVGITNALPAIPLDGGFMFRDGVQHIIERLGTSKEKAKKAAGNISTATALLILFLILWQLIGPRLSLI